MDWVGRFLTWLEPWLAYLLGLMQRSVTRPGRGRLGRDGARVEPCHLPVHARCNRLRGGHQEHHQAASGRNELAFVLGITTVYMMLGALWGSFGLLLLELLTRWLWLWYGIGAIALLPMGLRMIGLLYFNAPCLRQHNPMIGGRSVLGAYLLGLTFGLSGCPSCEPIRLAVLAATAASTQPFMGALAMLALGLGQGLFWCWPAPT